MPIYDYECEKCGHGFELRQSFNSEPETTCPVCTSRARRKFHSVAVIYKGSGFYTTDYKKNGYSPPGEEKETPAPKAKDTKTPKAKDEVSTAPKKEKE